MPTKFGMKMNISNCQQFEGASYCILHVLNFLLDVEMKANLQLSPGETILSRYGLKSNTAEYWPQQSFLYFWIAVLNDFKLHPWRPETTAWDRYRLHTRKICTGKRETPEKQVIWATVRDTSGAQFGPTIADYPVGAIGNTASKTDSIVPIKHKKKEKKGKKKEVVFSMLLCVWKEIAFIVVLQVYHKLLKLFFWKAK